MHKNPKHLEKTLWKNNNWLGSLSPTCLTNDLQTPSFPSNHISLKHLQFTAGFQKFRSLLCFLLAPTYTDEILISVRKCYLNNEHFRSLHFVVFH